MRPTGIDDEHVCSQGHRKSLFPKGRSFPAERRERKIDRERETELILVILPKSLSAAVATIHTAAISSVPAGMAF